MASDDPDPGIGAGSNSKVDEKLEENNTQSQVFGNANGAIDHRQINASHSLMDDYNPNDYDDSTKKLDDDQRKEKKRKTTERDIENDELKFSPKHQS